MLEVTHFVRGKINRVKLKTTFSSYSTMGHLIKTWLEIVLKTFKILY